jgi:hypothetical protein
MSANDLVSLAQKQFVTLTEAEKALFRAVASGEWADYTIGDEEKDKPANASDWGEQRTLAADRIAWLCTDKQARELVTNKGIQVKGARIEGILDIEQIDISFWLEFVGCALPQGMNLRQASVRGLDITGCQTGPISADGIKVIGDLSLNDGFGAEGEVRLIGAEIGGDLDCEKGQFSNPTGDALIANRIKVAGAVFLRSGFKAKGEIRLLSSDFGGPHQCHGVNSEAGISLDLRGARIGTLYDDAESWPDSGKLCLDGFVYARLDDRAPRDAKSRIEWLRRQPPGQFLPQPYEQLAAVFKNEGRESDAKKILIAKEEDPARLSQLNPLGGLWHYVSKLTICYGYRPWYALLWALALVIIGCIVFASGMKHGLVAPTSESAYIAQSGSGERQLADTYPRFNSLFYSLDVFLPIIDLHQEKYWLPHAERGAVVGWLQWVERLGLSAPTYGSLLRCYMWFQILAGWMLTSLFIAGLTRVVRS